MKLSASNIYIAYGAASTFAESHQCFLSESKSADGSAWSDLKQKLEALDLKETPPELETGGLSKSTTIYASDSKAHHEEIGEPSSGRSNLSDPTKVKGKDAIEASAQYGNHATDLSLRGNEPASDQGAQYTPPARSRLYEICTANRWSPPEFICCKEEGPSHLKLFTYKVTVEVKVGSKINVVECLGGPKPRKKAAAEHAAEGALWYLRGLGHKI
ncbi:hypothetical protein MRB53_009114 [Persea americana]|uniref:Uncharacterized protein n=1 Tax=Persea americana TaxID=3435 RepID=A0ACC2LP45_PERAE|nr:hypothetical protein MRB53_009114 [Persea americana]